MTYEQAGTISKVERWCAERFKEDQLIMAKSKQFRNQSNHEGLSYRIFDDVIDVASTLFRNRKSAGADRLRALAEATRSYAESMADLPTLQRQVNLASENIGHFADYVLHTDIQHMLNDATVLAKRRPLVTLGVAAAVGLAATRLVSTTAMPTLSKSRKFSKKTNKPRTAAKRTMNGSAHANA